MVGDELAHGRIVVELDDRATGDLERLRAQFKAEMAAIDREDATVDLEANVQHLKRDLDRARAEVKKYEKYVNDADTRLTREARQRSLERVKLAEQEAAAKHDAAEQALQDHRAEDRALSRTEKRRRLIARNEAAEERIREQNHRRAMARVREQERVSDRLSRVVAREEKGRLRDLAARNRAEERAAEQRRRELAEIPKLQREYVTLAHKIEKLSDARRKAEREGDRVGVQKIELDENLAVQKFHAIERRLEAEHAVVHIEVEPNVGRDWGYAIRRRLAGNSSMLSAASAVGAEVGERMAYSLSDRFDRVNRHTLRRGLVRGVEGAAAAVGRGLGRVGHILGNLSEMTVRIGPFTATIRQMFLALSVLGPMIVATIGAVGALGAAVGAAALGLGALTAGLAGGAIPAFAGMFLAVKPVVSQLQNAYKASKAYNDAVVKYGKNSTQAKDKLEQYNNTLKNQSKQTKENFLAAGKLNDAWKKATAPSRQAAFRLVGEGIKFASDNMDWFAKRTNGTTQAVSDGLTKMMRHLDTGAFDEMMGNFNKSLRPAISGVGNLVNYLARVGQVASRFLPNMARGFNRWSKGILDTTNNTSEFEGKIKRVVNVFRDFGDLVMSTGRLLKTVFAGGVDAGDNMMQNMTKAMDRWSKFLQTDKGQDALHNFFERSVSGATQLFHALAPLLGTFTKWATMMEPFSSAAFRVIQLFADLVAQINNLVFLRAPLTAFLTTLGTLWAIGKIKGAVLAVREFTMALLGLKAAETAVAAASTEAAGAGLLGTLLGRGGTAMRSTALTGMAADIALMGRNAEATATKSAGLGSTLLTIGRAAGPLGLTAAAVTAIGVAYAVFGNKTETTAEQVHQLADESRDLSEGVHKGITSATGLYHGLAEATSRQHSAQKSVADAQAEVDRLTRAGKTHTDAYRVALSQLNAALRERTDATRAANKAAEAIQKADELLTHSGEAVDKALEGRKKAMDALRETLSRTGSAWDESMFGGKRPDQINPRDLIKYREEFETLADRLRGMPGMEGIASNLEENLNAATDAMAALTRARGEDSRAARQQAVHAVNLKRALQEFAPLGRAAGEAMQQLTRSIGTKKTFEIAVKFPNPRQALNVMKSINNAIDQGVSKKRAINIALNSKTAEQALRRLDRLTIDDKDFKIVQRGGEDAVRLIEQILGKKLPPKIQAIVEKGGPKVVAMLQAIKNSRIPGKTQDIDEQGGSSVLSKLSFLRGFDIGQAIKRITEQGGSSVLGTLAQIAAKTFLGVATKFIDIVTRHKATGGVPVPGFADGRTPPTVVRRQAQLAASSLPTIGAGTTARGAKVRRPTLMVGEENRGEYVIATNPAYRKSNIKYLRMAAAELGVRLAAGGTKPLVSDKMRSNMQDHGHAGNPEKLPAVQRYYTLQKSEDDANREISIAEGKVKQPDSFIKEKGLNEWGEMEFEIDQSAITTFTKQLEAVSKKWALLTDPKKGIVAQMFKAAHQAYKALDQYRERRNKNITYWQGLFDHFKKIANMDLPDRKEGEGKEAYQKRRENARKRKEHAKAQMQHAVDEIRDQRAGIRDSRTVEGDIRDDEHDLGYRKQEYATAHADVISEKNSIGSRANDELSSSQPTAPELPSAAERDISRLEAEQALAEAGLGLDGAPMRDAAAITSDLIKAWGNRITEAQAMLHDANPYNDQDAYGILSSAGSAIAGLKGTSGTGGSGGGSGDNLTPAQQTYNLSGARSDLFRQFGSNFSTAGAFSLGAIGSGYAYGTPQYPSPYVGGGGTTVQINNTFPTPPSDPHIWSMGVQYELQAAL